jgi:hypothetical protein
VRFNTDPGSEATVEIDAQPVKGRRQVDIHGIDEAIVVELVVPQ